MGVLIVQNLHPCQNEFEQMWLEAIFLLFTLMRKAVCSTLSGEQTPLCSLNIPQAASDWLKSGLRATIWWPLKVNTRERLSSWILIWSLALSDSDSFFKQGPFLGNIDGKPGLLILEKALICSLLALRTLITPIVVLVPLRQEWMSLLCNSFLLPSKWRCSHQKRPDTESETSASRWTTYRLPIYFQLCDFNNLFAWYFSGSVILNFKYTI